METVRAFAGMSPAERERAIDDLIELVAAVDGLLQQQVAHDVANLCASLRRTFSAQERAELQREILRAKRWTFILSGVTHPRFEKVPLPLADLIDRIVRRGAEERSNA